VTHLCSDRVTHPKKQALPAGKESNRRFHPRRRRASPLYPADEPNAGPALPAGRAFALRQRRYFQPVWWVTFREQTWVTSRKRRSIVTSSSRCEGTVRHPKEQGSHSDCEAALPRGASMQKSTQMSTAAATRISVATNNEAWRNPKIVHKTWAGIARRKSLSNWVALLLFQTQPTQPAVISKVAPHYFQYSNLNNLFTARSKSTCAAGFQPRTPDCEGLHAIRA
jgi:hypothetical protein